MINKSVNYMIGNMGWSAENDEEIRNSVFAYVNGDDVTFGKLSLTDGVVKFVSETTEFYIGYVSLYDMVEFYDELKDAKLYMVDEDEQ